jgi:hypothetical protein
MYQTVAIAFIAVIGAAGLYVGVRPTVASSAGLEQVLKDSKAYGSGYSAYHCDDNVPIGVEGARYHCVVTKDGGDVEHLACAIYRTGMFKCTDDDADAHLDLTPPAEE